MIWILVSILGLLINSALFFYLSVIFSEQYFLLNCLPVTLNPKFYLFLLLPLITVNRLLYIIIYYINKSKLNKNIFSFIKFNIIYYNTLFYIFIFYNFNYLRKIVIHLVDLSDYDYNIYLFTIFLITLSIAIVLITKKFQIVFKNKFNYRTESNILLPWIFKNLWYRIYKFEEIFVENFGFQKFFFYIEIFISIIFPGIYCLILINTLYFGMDLRAILYLIPLNFMCWCYKIMKNFMCYLKNEDFFIEMNKLRLKNMTLKPKKKYINWKEIALAFNLINYRKNWFLEGSESQFKKYLYINHFIITNWYFQLEQNFNTIIKVLLLLKIIMYIDIGIKVISLYIL